METYDPTEDIERFRGYRWPWSRVESAPIVFHSAAVRSHLLEGKRVRPIAFDALGNRVLLHVLDHDHPYPLVVAHSAQPDRDFRETLDWYENIGEFDAEAY